MKSRVLYTQFYKYDLVWVLHMKVYLGGSMFTKADIDNNLRLAQIIRSYGIDVYCPNENSEINDKATAVVSSEDIYRSDIQELESCNVFICQVSEDAGTMWEAGYMDCLHKNVDANKYFGTIGLATDIRLQTMPDPQKSGVDNQAMYINSLVVGGLKLSLGIFTNEHDMLEKLRDLQGLSRCDV